MDTTLRPQINAPLVMGQAPAQFPTVPAPPPETSDNVGGSTILPNDQSLMGQAVSAQLTDRNPPERPATIAPEDRVLKPYDLPMLPAQRETDRT